MKKLFFILTVFVFATDLTAQTVNENFIDGRIYFKIKNEVPVLTSVTEDPRHVDPNTIPFIKSLDRNFRVKNLSRPFFAAKESSILQRTYLLEFENYQGADQLLGLIQNDPSVEYAERAAMRKCFVTPNDPGYSAQWELAQINAANAWAYSTGSSVITVAIVDDAIDILHPDLAPNIWTNVKEIPNNGIDDDGNGYIDDYQGYDVGDNDKDPRPTDASYFHGTSVAGCADAKSNNGIGGASIGYGISIIPIKCTSTSAYLTNSYDGLVYAGVMKARVVNMSWGGYQYNVTEQNVIDYAYGRGCVLVASAGNSTSNVPQYPASLNHIIAVGATTTSDVKSSYSNFGTWVDVCAPGDNIYTTAVGNSYTSFFGTSAASPVASGLCGLMLSLNPNLTQKDVESCLKSSAKNIDAVNSGYAGQLGAGRIDAGAAMACVNSTLNWKPVANFYANFTSVAMGGKVTYTDSTLYAATSWTWSFPGGAPSSYVGKIPPQVIYNTPGTYSASLTASNANGSDSKTRTSYITVTSNGGCDLVNYSNISPNVIWNAIYYSAGAGLGYVTGKNSVDGGSEVAQYFDVSGSTYTKMKQALIYFAKSNSTNPANLNKLLTIKVYDGTSGTPGTLLGSTTKTLKECGLAPIGSRTVILFPKSINLPASQKFFISVDYSALVWTSSERDTLCIVSNHNGQTVPSGAWVFRNNAWGQFGTPQGNWQLKLAMFIFPALTNTPPLATFTTSGTNICKGESVHFNAAGSTYEDTLVWYFTGGASSVSNAINPSNIYNQVGTFKAELYVIGGGCSGLDSLSALITVKDCDGIKEFFSADNINAFYNSSEHKCYLDINNRPNNTEQLKLRLWSPLGQLVYTDEFNMNGTELRKTIDMNQLAHGIYIVQLLGNNGSYQRKLLAD